MTLCTTNLLSYTLDILKSKDMVTQHMYSGKGSVLGAVVFVAIFGALLFLPTASNTVSKSSEVGFVSLSPNGVSGGVIIPASCEAAFEHFAGECGVPEGDLPDIICPTGNTLQYDHPAKTCSNGMDTVTTPVLPRTTTRIPWTVESIYNRLGASKGYWTGYSYCWGNAVNGVCPSSLVKGSFDFSEARISGVHESALFCFARNVPVCVPTTVVCPDGQAYVAVTQSCVNCSNGGCTGTGGNPSNSNGGLSCNNRATNPPACILTPTANLWVSDRSKIDVGQSTTLRWSSTNATSCEFVGTPPNEITTRGATSNSAPGLSTGSLTVVGIQNYQLTCSEAGRTSVPSLASVQVLAPDATISASPTRVHAHTSSTITWSANGIQSCSITKNGAAWKPPTYTNMTPPSESNTLALASDTDTITAQSTFTITCLTNDPAKPKTASVIVNIVPVFKEF